jgi:hypothetical protein
MGRGIKVRPIFLDGQDRTSFLDYLPPFLQEIRAGEKANICNREKEKTIAVRTSTGHFPGGSQRRFLK